MTRSLLLAVCLLLAGASSAQLALYPPGPTSDDDVVVRFARFCGIAGHTVSRTGSEISVTLQNGPCGEPPYESPYDVSLGELPPGQYRVTVAGHGSLTFVVRDGDARYRFRPWAIPANAETVVQLVHDDPRGICGTPNCFDFFLEIGGRTYSINDLRTAEGTLSLRLPPQPPGLLHARIGASLGVFELPAALYVYDPSAPPDPQAFERVLFPVLFSANGANGSRWRSEAVIVNPNPWTVRPWNNVERLVCTTLQWPCNPPLAPKSRRAFEGEGYPRGATLLVPRGEADDLSFSLRIRDVSRDAESYGTQVPVVRERDLFREMDAVLLDVPLDPRFRTKVRLYGYPDLEYASIPPQASVRVGDSPQGVLLRLFCDGLECLAAAHYAEVDLPPGAPGQRADVTVRFVDGVMGWAFASVTNNVTQQVTIIAPDGKGRR
jgi:hypothetical protein